MRLFGNILDDIQFKGGKTNVIIKWIIGIAITGIAVAFVLGQLKMRHLNKLDDIEALATEGIQRTEILEEKMDIGLNQQNIKIDKIYDDGIEAFNEYRKFNNEQMKLIIDYGHENKELLKKMLELNSMENSINLENKLYKSKRDNVKTILDSFSSLNNDNTFSKISPQELKLIEPNVAIFSETESGRKTYYVLNAPRDYIDTLNINQFEIIEISKSRLYDGLYNFVYKNKINYKNNENE